jgi:Bacterial type II/III secretion system short domain
MVHRQSRLFVLLLAFLLPALCLHSTPARAETDTIEVMYLPLDEAAAAVQSQLSAAGRIAQLPSQRLLIVSDDAAHIEKARELLRRLDTPPTQLAVQVGISGQSEAAAGAVSVAGLALPGGWVRIEAAAGSRSGRNTKQFMLRTSSGADGHIEAGEIRAVQQSVRQYLSAHGIVRESNVALLDVTAGFDVRATLLAGNEVRLNIRPWLMDAAPHAGGMPSTGRRHGPDTPQRIMVAEAATEVTVKLGEQVTLAASDSAANEFSTVLLGLGSQRSEQHLVISVSVSKAGM